MLLMLHVVESGWHIRPAKTMCLHRSSVLLPPIQSFDIGNQCEVEFHMKTSCFAISASEPKSEHLATKSFILMVHPQRQLKCELVRHAQCKAPGSYCVDRMCIRARLSLPCHLNKYCRESEVVHRAAARTLRRHLHAGTARPGQPTDIR